MLFFDTNVRLGRAANPFDSLVNSVDQLIKCMDYYQIGKALVYHKEALKSVMSGNDILSREIRGMGRLVGCAILVPSCTGELGNPERYIQHLLDKGIRAVRFFPKENYFSIKEYSMRNILRPVEDHKIPVLIDFEYSTEPMMPYCSWDHTSDFDSIYELSCRFKNVKFILLNAGMRNQRYIYALLEACNNIIFECSTYGYRNIEDICTKFGAHRLVWGSHLPQIDPGISICALMYSNIDEEQRALIGGQNLQNLVDGVVL